MASFRPVTRIFSSRLLATPRTATAAVAPIQILRVTQHIPLPPQRQTRHNSSIPQRDLPVPTPGPSSSSSRDPSLKSPGEPTEPLSSGIPKSTIYNYEDIKNISHQITDGSTTSKVLIDVREPSELLGTGRIPGSKNVPISSAADGFFLPAEEFEEKFGFERPGDDVEVVFYCKAGVRSKAAARLAGQAGFGGSVGEFPGSWVEWSERGGEVERED